jgi:hypothetical protein
MGMKWIVLGGAALACAVSASAEQGGGERSYRVAGFDSVTAGGAHRVVVTVGGGHSVRATGPAEVLDRMEVLVEDSRLIIRPVRESWVQYGRRDEGTATFYVSVPRLARAAVAGSGNMTVDRVEGDAFSASVAGSGNLAIASMRVSDARFSVAGSGDLAARGSAGRSRVSLAGSGRARLGDVASRDSTVSIVGSGSADLNATGTVNASIAGSGAVTVAGSARCSKSGVGTGRMMCESGAPSRGRPI